MKAVGRSDGRTVRSIVWLILMTVCPSSRLTALQCAVAVLPFDNLSRDSGDPYLASGLTDEITTRLTGIERLTVTSATIGGDTAAARTILRTLPAEGATLVLLALGDTSAALANVLRTGAPGPWLTFRGPEFDGLRRFPEFVAMTQRARD